MAKLKKCNERVFRLFTSIETRRNLEKCNGMKKPGYIHRHLKYEINKYNEKTEK